MPFVHTYCVILVFSLCYIAIYACAMCRFSVCVMCGFLVCVMCAYLVCVMCAFRRWLAASRLAARFARVARFACLFVTLTFVRRVLGAYQ